MKSLLDTLNGALGKSGLSDMLQSTVGNVLGAGQQNEASSSQPQKGGGLSQAGGMAGAAALGGLLGVLFGGKDARKFAKGALTVGGTAAAGALAWKFYQKWSENRQPSPDSKAVSVGQPGTLAAARPAQSLPQEEQTALVLLEAMVFAARADGHIDADEQRRIQAAAEQLFPERDFMSILQELLISPIDPVNLASRIGSPEEGRDLYRLSCAVVEIDSFMERSYLNGLAQALGIAEAERIQLEQEALAARTTA